MFSLHYIIECQFNLTKLMVYCKIKQTWIADDNIYSQLTSNSWLAYTKILAWFYLFIYFRIIEELIYQY